jgi:hypothetical protein
MSDATCTYSSNCQSQDYNDVTDNLLTSLYRLLYMNVPESKDKFYPISKDIGVESVTEIRVQEKEKEKEQVQEKVKENR